MKTAAIIKIVLWSLVAVVLIGVFIGLAGFDGLDLPGFVLNWPGREFKVIREQQFSVDDIDSIDIKWTSGSFYILPASGERIIVTEKSNRQLSDKELLQISVENGRLTMEQGEMERRFFVFSIGEIVITEIMLPIKHYNEIKTQMTSGKLVMNDLDAGSIIAGMTSGLMQFDGVSAEELFVNMTSGKIDLSGDFNDIHVESTSGMVNLETDLAPSTMFIKISSGSVNVAIPDNEGFSVSKKLTSGVFKSDFEIDDFGRYKDGGHEYRVVMTSGAVELKKK